MCESVWQLSISINSKVFVDIFVRLQNTNLVDLCDVWLLKGVISHTDWASLDPMQLRTRNITIRILAPSPPGSFYLKLIKYSIRYP